MSGINIFGNLKGRPVHGYLSSADASAGAALNLVKPGTTTADAVGADERIIITDFSLIAANGGACALYAAASAAAQYVVCKGTVAANGGFMASKFVPTFGKKAEGPFVVAPAGQVDVVVEGIIIKAAI